MLLWTDAYLGDTQHLTTLEHGAYLLILIAMWRAGGSLPNDEVRLARTAKLTLDKWRKCAPTIMEFMTSNGDAIIQKRLKLELEIASGKRKKAADAGRAGGRAKSLKRLIASNSDASFSLDKKPSDSSVEVAQEPYLEVSGTLPNQLPVTNNQLLEPNSPDCEVAVAVPATSKAKRAKPRSAMDPEMQPEHEDRAKATEAGMKPPTFRHEWRQFRDHHLKEAKASADWRASWRTWVGNWIKFGMRQVGPSAAPSEFKNPIFIAAQELEKRYAAEEQRRNDPAHSANPLPYGGPLEGGVSEIEGGLEPGGEWPILDLDANG
jgi:uncharacterized protein YdaU (DUF1376 family)